MNPFTILTESQRVQAEAGALRELLRQFLYDPEVLRDMKAFGDKVKAALEITDLGRETALALEMDRETIHWLTQARNQLATKQRVVEQVLRSNHCISAESLTEAIHRVLSTIRGSDYANTLSRAIEFSVYEDSLFEITISRVHPGKWLFLRGRLSHSEITEFENWTPLGWAHTSSSVEAALFPTADAAFAYLESHPQMLTLSASEVCDTISVDSRKAQA